MIETKNKECKGHSRCQRIPVSDGLCAFHLPSDHKNSLSCDKYNDLLIEEIKEAKENRDDIFELHWEGFNFPKDHVLFDFLKFEAVSEKLSKSWINIRESNIQNILIAARDIHTLILSDSIVHGDTTIGVADIRRISTGKTIFHGKFHCASRTHEFDARGAIFEDEFSFTATIYKRAIFTNCRFLKSCIFSGVSGQVFENNADNEFRIVGFDYSIFGKPNETLFQDVDLRKASFNSVALVDVRFNNTNFYQEELNRNGLYNEVKELQKNNKPSSNQAKNNNTIKRFHHLIYEYRQIRMAMESNKEYTKAHDFYIGEMESRQRQNWSFVIGLYRFSSHFGTNYTRAFCILICMFIIHFFLSIILSPDISILKLCCDSNMANNWLQLSDIAIHSISTGTLQRVGLLENTSNWQSLIDLIFRVLIPIQAAMFVLALRNKTKR